MKLACLFKTLCLEHELNSVSVIVHLEAPSDTIMHKFVQDIQAILRN